MADLYTKPYFESSVWIAWLKGEVEQSIDRRKVADHLFRHASDGKFAICTSTLTLAEVHKKRHGSVLAHSDDEKILDFFEQEFIEVINVDRIIGEQANRLCREFGLSPCDGIHLASALRAHCDYLLTWDTGMLKCRHPDIQIATPEMRGQQFLDLPDLPTA